MEGIIILHNYIFFYLILIFIFIFWFLTQILYQFFFIFHYPKSRYEVTWIRFHYNSLRNITHFSQLEIIWTLLPGLVLILIAVPSFSLLYAMDEVLNPLLTFKAIGHQWYWSYEFSDSLFEQEIVFDSNVLFESQLNLGEFRLLSVDNPLVLPTNTHIRTVVTSMDVLHSWAIPSYGIKIDACPGRLNQVFLFIQREGTFYGQCSELCGVSHSIMPITVKAISI